MHIQMTRHPGWALSLMVLLLAATAACGGKKSIVPAGTAQPDRYLFDRGNEEVQKKHWVNARVYFQQIVDNYPQSPLRPDAKLGLGDSHLGEGSSEQLVYAANEFREFLQFYPTHARADYAQYKLAMSHFKQMRAPERDQTETKEALKAFNEFFERYPTSTLTPQVRKDWREARDRLSASSFHVGLFYFRSRWYPGAIDRLREVLRDDPSYTGRDAVYFYLAEALTKTDKKAEALPYFDRLVKEFEQSEYLGEARKRMEELKTQ